MQDKGVVVVSLDLPTSHGPMADLTATPKDDKESFTQAILRAINGMLMDMLVCCVAQRLQRPPPSAGTRHR